MNAFAQKKVLTFNKFTGDFDFKVHYGDMEHLNKEVSWVGPTLLSNTHVSGVEEPLEKHKDLDCKGIKAHFNLDDSGLLHVTSVESVFEKTITVEEQEKAEAEKEAAEKLKSGENSDKNETEDSWAKLGDTISNFFGEKEETEEGAKEETKEKSAETSERREHRRRKNEGG